MGTVPVLTFYRNLVITIILVGASVSMYLMFETGNRQSSLVLMALFTGWNVSPFVAMLIAMLMSQRWSWPLRRVLYLLFPAITTLALAIYSGVINFGDAKPAFVFLVVPFFSWLILILFYLMNRSRLRNSA